MGWEAWLTICMIVFLLLALAQNWAPADLLFVGGLAILVLVGIVTGSAKLPKVETAFAGFSNPGLITVGALFVVVTGLIQTGAMSLVTQPLLGRPKTVLAAQSRVMLLVTGLSAFLNNTPVVAMFMPVVDDICKKTRISPSKLFMPMAFAATFGGTCTLIGTSTNLVVDGLVQKADLPALRMFDVTWVGVPCALAAIGFTLLASRFLLPDRRPAISLSDDPRQYTVEMLVQAGGPLVGQSVEAAGLRHLPGLYLAEISRGGGILAAVSPHERFQAGDRLVFVGIVESVVDLQKIRGLIPATDQMFKLDAPRAERCLLEAVVSDRCPLVGKSIREGQFRSVYDAAVIAVGRSGKRIASRIGDIILQPGDTLLLEAHSDFRHKQRNSSHFFLVSGIENSSPVRYESAWVALFVLAALVVFASFEWIDMLTASIIAAMGMIVFRCCTVNEARQNIEWSVLVTIGASLGVGKAMEVSGAASAIAETLINAVAGEPWLVLAMVYFVTMIFTEIVTNNAAAVLVFPIALSAARTLEVNHMPFIIAIMIGASAGYATPIGYQTNLMVYGPGGYKFTDYMRLGIPLDLLYMAVTVGLAPILFPF